MIGIVFGFALVFAAGFVSVAFLQRLQTFGKEAWSVTAFLITCSAVMARDFADHQSKLQPEMYWLSAMLGMEISLVIVIAAITLHIAYRKLRPTGP